MDAETLRRALIDYGSTMLRGLGGRHLRRVRTGALRDSRRSGQVVLSYVPPDRYQDAMRMLLKAHMDTRKANEGNQDGTLPERLGQLMDQLQPEAAYFYPENGKRTVFIVFDMQDPSQIPPTLEPLFQGGEASVSLTPVMSREDLQSGVQEVYG